MPITFEVDPSQKPGQWHPCFTDLKETFEGIGIDVITATNSKKDYFVPPVDGLVGACMTAYNLHYGVELGPDEIWITITTSLARYIDAYAEELRSKFVNHEGKVRLTAISTGDMYSADYDNLIGQLTQQIEDNTKRDIRKWIECDFSTTTPTKRVVSQIVLMGAMQKYFSYRMTFLCGLPRVTLLGTEEDWKKLLLKVEKLKEFDSTLAQWSEVLTFVLNHFVDAFSGNIDKDFWNRIARRQSGGSGSTYVEGWSLAFIGFKENGRYFLNSLDDIQKSNNYGYLEIDDVPVSFVKVPVEIDDHGQKIKTMLYSGILLSTIENDVVTPVLDWVLTSIFITKLIN